MPKCYIEKGTFFCQDAYKRVALRPAALAKLAGVDRKTAVRWCNDRQNPHPDRSKLVALRALGRVLPASGIWAGVWIENDALRLADGGTVPAAALPARAFERQHLELLKTEIRQARQYIVYLESLVPRAAVITFRADKARPTTVPPLARLNPYFEGTG